MVYMIAQMARKSSAVEKAQSNSLQWRHNERCRLKSPASRLFTQPFIQAQTKENIKGPRHWPLWGVVIGDP